MKNLYLRFSPWQIIFLNLGLILLALVYATYTYGADPVFFGFLFIGLIGLFQTRLGQKENEDIFAKMETISQQIAEGKLEYRITRIPEKSPWASMAHNMNEATDQLETFMREVSTVFKYAEKGIFSAPPCPLACAVCLPIHCKVLTARYNRWNRISGRRTKIKWPMHWTN